MNDGCKLVEVEPKTLSANSNGYQANGNGTIPVNGNGYIAIPTNGNSYNGEDLEPQRSLFSWAEVMAEEAVKPKGRRRKLQPASLSMFEWALELEREKQQVCAGR